MSGISELLQEIQEYGHRDPGWHQKMVHKIPERPSVDRRSFILERCRGEVVLDIGCAGPLGQQIREVAVEYHGIDVLPGDWLQMDLDHEAVPQYPGVSVIVCGETLEHLTNPGFFLRNLTKVLNLPDKIFTVPNAFCETNHRWVRAGVESVNRDHVAWYSYKTLTTLFEKCGYEVVDWMWYNGPPRTAEGLIMVTR